MVCRNAQCFQPRPSHPERGTNYYALNGGYLCKCWKSCISTAVRMTKFSTREKGRRTRLGRRWRDAGCDGRGSDFPYCATSHMTTKSNHSLDSRQRWTRFLSHLFPQPQPLSSITTPFAPTPSITTHFAPTSPVAALHVPAPSVASLLASRQADELQLPVHGGETADWNGMRARAGQTSLAPTICAESLQHNDGSSRQ